MLNDVQGFMCKHKWTGEDMGSSVSGMNYLEYECLLTLRTQFYYRFFKNGHSSAIGISDSVEILLHRYAKLELGVPR